MNDETFLKEDLINLRKDLSLTQQEMADHLGMALRSYQDIEAGESKYRFIHRLAAERISLAIAADKGDAKIVPPSVRDDAIEFVRLGTHTGNPAYRGDGNKKSTAKKIVEEDADANFRAAYAVVGELILINTGLDYQLNHILIQVLHLTDSPMLESVIATLDMARKIEMLKARLLHIRQPQWRKSVLSYLDKLERVSKWRNIACHTALIPDEKHGAVFAPAAASKLLKSLQLGEAPKAKRIPIADVRPITKLAETALYDGEVVLHNFRNINAHLSK